MTANHLKTRPCPACGSEQGAAEVRSRRPAECLPLRKLRAYWSGLDKERVFFTYQRCARCGLLYNRQYFLTRVLSELYGGLAPNMDMVPAPHVGRTQRGYLDNAIAGGAPLDGDYLEIGPDVGHLAAAAAQRGNFRKFWLFEPNRRVHGELAAAVGEANVELTDGMADISAVPDGSVGLAVMVHVLDHLLDPLDLVRQIRSKLRPDGMLAIVTHDESSRLRRLLRRRWPPFCLQHPQLYNPHTIRGLLARAGYDNVRVEPAVNHYPSDFLVRQAMQAVGVKLGALPLPAVRLPLRLGNMLTLARGSAQAAARLDTAAHSA